MFQIEPDLLWLGHAGDGRDVARVLDANIRAVVQLAFEEPPVDFPRDVIVIRIPLYDGGDNAAVNLQLAVHTVEQLLTAGVPTLICCGAGMSRAPAVAACALAHISGKSPAECLQSIRTHHGTDVSATLWHDLLASLDA